MASAGTDASGPNIGELSGNGDSQPVAMRRRLTSDEQTALKRCEKIIRKGAAEFIRVGLALREIRDRRLYRETHSSFEAYCLARFDFKRAHGYRLIAEATAVLELKQLSPIGDRTPCSSRINLAISSSGSSVRGGGGSASSGC